MNHDLLQESLEAIDMASWMDREGIVYRERRGSSGQQLNVKECPSCGNEKWKTYLNAETGRGNCFVCDAKFNKFTFIRAALNIENKAVIEHVQQVARELGWRPPRTHAVAVELPKLELPPSVELPVNGRNLAYLERRGVSGEIARYFNLRFCLRGTFGGQSYANRVIIPVFDLDGNLVSFQGRDITGESDRKYLFPAGFASTGAHLYNGQNVHRTTRVVVGEGVFDVIATKIALDGDPALRDVVPIGTFGKHLSRGDGDSQEAKFLQLKERGIEQVTMMWDAEPAALTAAIDAGTLLKSLGFTVRIALLPPGKDPNECSAEAVRQAFWKADVLTAANAARLRLSLRPA